MYHQISNNPFRKLVVGVDVQIPLSNGAYTTAINLDNAATTPPFLSVMREINKFAPWYSSIHRGKGYKSMLSTDIYENGREIIKKFVKADKKKDIVIYTKNTTDSINILSYVLSQKKEDKNVVISSWMEHAANDLPWRNKFIVDYIDIDKSGRLVLNDLEAKLRKYNGKVKLVTVTAAANVTGYINPIHEIAKLAHKYKTKVLIDAAQLVPHDRIDMKPFGSDEHIDYLVFSAHKMYAPFGSGVLIGPKDDFEYGLPYAQGGSAIRLVTHSKVAWDEPPAKDEAGTPNLMGIVALIEAIKTFNFLGFRNIDEYEKLLHQYAYRKIKGIPGIKIYNDYGKDDTLSIIPFNIKGMHHQIVSKILSFEFGIAVRNGFFCAHPYCERLLGYSEKDMAYYFDNQKALLPGMVRASIGMYNTFEEIDRLIYSLNTIVTNKNYYVKKYENNRVYYKIKNEV
ncbi:MAG: aminotransferase class V-fold PLP-dependent enzyme [Marinisporobacter sp.]|jgi:selenocysteine lyase/cysteine desulfurase|nr:aminotransferase class V-fold PLP-dependent enzyme [Marinisporobacter sp.]